MTVLVIGAGIIGTAIAEGLAVRGVDVTVVDMRGPARGATQASAGLLAPFLEAHDDPPFLDLAVRSLELYESFIARLRERVSTPIEYARTGTLEVALSDAELTALRVAHRALEKRHVSADWIDGPALRAFEPTLTEAAVAGLLTPAHGLVGASALVKALVESARLAGATFEQPVQAAEIEPGAGQATIMAGGRSYTADWVVVAAGSWSTRVRVRGAAMPVVRPIRGQLIHLAWSGTLPARPVWDASCYTVPWTDGSLLVGATVEDVGFDERSTVAGVDDLLSGVRRLLPRSADASVREVRVGLRPSTPDHLPWIGPLPSAPRVVVATGHYRNGVLLAPLTAHLVSRLIVDGEADPLLRLTALERATVM